MDEQKPTDRTMAEPETSQKEELRSWRETPANDPFLVIVSGSEKGKKILLVSAVTSIGRSAHCNIQLKDSRASRVHAEFIRESEDFLLNDKGSANGTWVNGSRIESRKLRDGDRVTIGSTEMILTIPARSDETSR